MGDPADAIIDGERTPLLPTNIPRISHDGLTNEEFEAHVTALAEAGDFPRLREMDEELKAHRDDRRAAADFLDAELARFEEGRRLMPGALTPAQVVDAHVDLARWLRTDFGYRVTAGAYPGMAGLQVPAADGGGSPIAPIIEQADLFYVDDEVAYIAAEAADDLDGMPLRAHHIPTKNTLIFFDTSDPAFVYGPGLEDEHRVAVRAVSITVVGTRPPGGGPMVPGVSVAVWADVDTARWIFTRVPGFDPNTYPPAIPFDFTGWSFDDDWSVEVRPDLDAGVRSLRRWLLSVLLLLAEPRYSARERVDRPARRRLAASPVKAPEDGCLSVTRLRTPHREVRTGPSESGRVYTHRWMVRGHWRRYHNGEPLERPKFIAPYVKGPEGAPFIRKRKVTVVQR